MFTALLLTAAAAVDVPAPKPTEKVPPPRVKSDVDVKSGYYRCRGSANSGARYEAVVIVRKVKNTYVFTWVQENGTAITGAGQKDGDKIVVGWGAGQARGVTVFDIKGPERLEGRYVIIPGDGEAYDEMLDFLKEFERPSD